MVANDVTRIAEEYVTILWKNNVTFALNFAKENFVSMSSLTSESYEIYFTCKTSHFIGEKKLIITGRDSDPSIFGFFINGGVIWDPPFLMRI